jgi:uncharacterized RDD family membrane protein YckC
MTTADDYINRVLENLPRSTPMRSQIAMELRGHIAERTAAGQSMDAALEQLGDPKALAESYLCAVPLESASFLRRGAAKAIDIAAVVFAVAVPTAWIGWRFGSAEFAPVLPFLPIVALLAGSFGFGLYTIVSEYWLGHTLGKHLLGLQVVRESGTPIGLGQSIVRQLPMFLQVYWIDVLFALFTERSQRAFELLSKSRVVVLRDRTAAL